MKKILTLLLAVLTVLLCTVSVFATGETAPAKADVFVSISDDKGEIVLANVPVVVKDKDGDGVLTVNDALIAAHEEYCKNGYAYSTVYGAAEITKLWNIENADYGCILNGASAWSLVDFIADEDYIHAFVYTDKVFGSDAISYFTKSTGEFKNGKETMKLFAYSYTEDGNLLSRPVAGAIITVNGKETSIKTAENGEFTITLADLEMDQKNIVSAKTKDFVMVPPIFTATIGEVSSNRMASVSGIIIVIVVIAVLLVGCIAAGFLLTKKKHK